MAISSALIGVLFASEEYCRRSIVHKVDLLHQKYQRLLDREGIFAPSSPLNEKKVPEDLQAIADRLQAQALYADEWDMRFLTGHFTLDRVTVGEEEKLQGRCGGFADYFLTEASKLGYRVTMYFGALPRTGNPFHMHFYGIAEKNGKYFELNAVHSEETGLTISILPYTDEAAMLEKGRKSYSVLLACFPPTCDPTHDRLASAFVAPRNR